MLQEELIAVMPIEVTGSLLIRFWSGGESVKIILPNAVNVPLLGYNLLSLKMLGNRGHEHFGVKKRETVPCS